MRRTRRTATTLTLLVAVACLTWFGCERGDQAERGGKSKSEKPRIALIMKARTNPFFHQMEVGARRAADKHGVDLRVASVDRETDFAKQGGLVENAIAQGVDAILIAPADSKAIVSPLLDAQGKGIKIINLDNRIDPEAAKSAGLNVETFIGPDNADGAYKASLHLIKLMGGKGKVALVSGIPGVDNGEQRKKGFFKAVAEHKDTIQLMAEESADWMTEPALRKMSGILARHPDITGVFCANDSMALGAIQAVESAGKAGKIFIVGYDGIKPARDAIRAGKMHGTIEQHPDLMGERGVETALKILAGQTVPKEMPTRTDLITAETLREEK
ncbi:MAG: substrate-binding domain-containing protein [Phycisphaerae bacterium]|nr:substrate-binding domain-containing protein [Phycisphaerae bacterium]